MLKSLELTLENCEVITVDGSDVKVLFIDTNNNNEEILKSFAISLNKNANKPYGTLSGNKTAFDRLTDYNDITQIDITTEESGVETNTHYYVTWDDDYDDEYYYEAENQYQKSFIRPNGDLCVIVSKEDLENILK